MCVFCDRLLVTMLKVQFKIVSSKFRHNTGSYLHLEAFFILDVFLGQHKMD